MKIVKALAFLSIMLSLIVPMFSQEAAGQAATQYVNLGSAAGASASAAPVTTTSGTAPVRAGGPVAIGTGMQYEGQAPVAPVTTTLGTAPLNAAGSWSLNLVDSVARGLNMTLFQNAGIVMGYGTVAIANATQPVTVAGAVTGSAINLYVTAEDGSAVYAMALAQSGNSVTGSYNAYTASGQTWVGTATGRLYASAPGAYASNATAAGVPPAGIVPAGITVGGQGAAYSATPTPVTQAAVPVTSVPSSLTASPPNGTGVVSTSYTSTFNGMSTSTNNGVTTVTNNGGVITSGDGTASTSYG